jgi:hypothetical protein
MKDGVKKRIAAASTRLDRPKQDDGARLYHLALTKAVLRCAARKQTFTINELIDALEIWASDKPDMLKEASAEAIAQLREAIAVGPD